MRGDEMPDNPKVTDPDGAPETLCDGRFHLYFHGRLATLTLTHNRPAPADMFAGNMVMEEVVRARVTLTLENLTALRDLLNDVIKTRETQSTESTTNATGGGTKH